MLMMRKGLSLRRVLVQWSVRKDVTSPSNGDQPAMFQLVHLSMLVELWFNKLHLLQAYVAYYTSIALQLVQFKCGKNSVYLAQWFTFYAEESASLAWQSNCHTDGVSALGGHRSTAESGSSKLWSQFRMVCTLYLVHCLYCTGCSCAEPRFRVSQ